MDDWLDLLGRILFLMVVFIATVTPQWLKAAEPKHVNPPVTVEGETVTMKFDFWKHTVDTMNYQTEMINRLQEENLVLKTSLKYKFECKKGGL